MTNTQFNGRIRMKVDSTENWQQAANFIPLKGEIIVYSDYASKEVDGETKYIPNFKIGDGMAYGIDLPFVSDDLRDSLLSHMSDRNLHITNEERVFWNNKVRCYIDTEEDEEEYIIDGETLVFTVN